MSILKFSIFCLIFVLGFAQSQRRVKPCTDDYFQGSCYKFIPNSAAFHPKFYFQQICGILENSSLLTLNSETEVQYISEQMTSKGLNSTWLNYIILPTDWQWTHDPSKVLKGQGCWTDGGDGSRDLNGKFQFYPTHNAINFDDGLTIKDCMAKCTKENYRYAGVQAGDYCYCGNSYGTYSRNSECNNPCKGNTADQKHICGGPYRNNVYLVDGVFSSWLPGYPLNQGQCAYIDAYKDYKWADGECGKTYAAICKKDSPNVQENDPFWKCFNLTKACYGLMDNSKGYSWFQAKMECMQKGGDLVSIESRAEESIIINNIIAAPESHQLYHLKFWIGASNILVLMSDGTTLKNFFNWGVNEPRMPNFFDTIPAKGRDRTQLCVYQDKNDKADFVWKSAPCNKSINADVICERKAEPISSTTTTTTTTTTSTSTTTTTSATPSTSALLTTETRSKSPSTSTTSFSSTKMEPETMTPSTSTTEINNKDNNASKIEGSTTENSFFDEQQTIIYIIAGVGIIALIVFLSACLICCFFTKKSKSRYNSKSKNFMHREVIGADNSNNDYDEEIPRAPERSTSLYPSAMPAEVDIEDEKMPIPPERYTSLQALKNDDGSHSDSQDGVQKRTAPAIYENKMTTFSPKSNQNSHVNNGFDSDEYSDGSHTREPYYANNTKDNSYASSAF